MKNKIPANRLVLSLIFLFSVTNCQLVLHQKNINYAQATPNAANILAQAKEEVKAPAISVAIGIDNRIVWAEALGYQNLEKAESADIHTKFRVGSSSKAVTSVALGKLIQNKQINLDAPVQEYVPFFDPAKPPITIRQLASHSSGIRNYKESEFNSNTEYPSIAESMKVFMYDSLLFQPGSKFSYTTYNYTVLSAAIEQITQLSFLDYMQQEVFAPLRMKNTSGDYKNKDIPNRAEFYNYDAKENKFKKAPEVNNSNKWAGGGLLSTPTDLVKLGNALLNNTILEAPTTAILFEPQKLNNGKVNGINYALGWKNDTTQLFNGTKPVQQLHHGGSASGSTSLLVLFPAYNLSISILVNRAGFASANLFKYAHKMAEAFIAEKTERATTQPNKAKVSQVR